MSAPEVSGIEALVCADIAARQALGIKKYGQTVADNPLPLRAWLRHGYEEALDLAVYLRRSMAEIDARGGCLSDPDIVQNLVHMAKGRNEAAEAISRLLDAQVEEIKRLRAEVVSWPGLYKGMEAERNALRAEVARLEGLLAGRASQ